MDSEPHFRGNHHTARRGVGRVLAERRIGLRADGAESCRRVDAREIHVIEGIVGLPAEFEVARILAETKHLEDGEIPILDAGSGKEVFERRAA